jgi:prepilin-type processing-associated H-X9-DG protein
MPNENDRPWDRGGRDREDEDDRPRRRDRDNRDDRDDDDDRPRRRRYEDEDDDRPRRRGSGAEASNGLAVAGLILGLLSFCTCLTAIPGAICSAIALGKPTGRGMAVAGLVLSILGALVSAGAAYFAFTKVRTAGTRMVDSNNLKQIGLAMHSVHNRTEGMSQYAQDKFANVQTGSSFRVGLLPFVEQENLYRRFDLTQPWDSPANRSLSNTPLPVYTSPYDMQEPSTNTPYRVFVGGGAMFNEDGKPIPLTRITDGTSNTIMLVHAVEYVPWAEPRELRYSANSPVPRIGHPALVGGSNVLMADGSVRFIREGISDRTMRALITRAGGEIITDDF